MKTNAQIFLHPAAAAATHLACIARIDLHHTTPSVFSFVRCEENKTVPRCVRDGFSETVIAEHTSNVQIFKADDSKSIGQLSAFLMSKVAPFVGHSLVKVRDYFARLLSLPTSLRRRAQFPLSLCQSLFFCTEESRILDRFTVGQHGKFFQPAVNPRLIECDWQWLRLALDRKASEPLARRCPRDGQCFDFPFHRAMQFDFHPSDFRQPQFALLYAEARLRVGEARISRASAEARESGFLSCFDPAEESVEGFVQSPQHFLQDLRVNPVQVGSNLLDVGELVYLIVAAYRLAAEAVSVASFLKRGVVEFATKPERRLKPCYLSATWVDAIFESLEHPCFVGCESIAKL